MTYSETGHRIVIPSPIALLYYPPSSHRVLGHDWRPLVTSIARFASSVSSASLTGYVRIDYSPLGGHTERCGRSKRYEGHMAPHQPLSWAVLPNCKARGGAGTPNPTTPSLVWPLSSQPLNAKQSYSTSYVTIPRYPPSSQ